MREFKYRDVTWTFLVFWKTVRLGVQIVGKGAQGTAPPTNTPGYGPVQWGGGGGQVCAPHHWCRWTLSALHQKLKKTVGKGLFS